MAAMSVSGKSAASSALVQTIREIVTDVLKSSFASTLATEPNMVDITMAIIKMESGARPDIHGKSLSETISSRARDYVNSDPVKAIYQTGTSTQKSNADDGKIAFGLMGVMGWNIVRGGSARAKRCELQESKRQDLAGPILLNAGESIRGKLLGEANMRNNIIAGLLILELKYVAVRQDSSGGWTSAFTKGKSFPSKMAAALGAYLGGGAKDLITGITPSEYANSVLYGKSYQAVQAGAGRGLTYARSAVAQNGAPLTNGSGLPAVIPGC